MTVRPPRMRKLGRLYAYWILLMLNPDASATRRIAMRRELFEALITRHGHDAVLRHTRAISRAIRPAEDAARSGLHLGRLTRPR